MKAKEIIGCALILGATTAVSLPALREPFERKRIDVCVSKMHELERSLQLYKSDFGDFPLRGKTGAAMKMYPTKEMLRCMNDTRWQNGKSVLSYVVQGTPDIPERSPEPISDALAYSQCRIKRGNDFPLILDLNHASHKTGFRSGVQVWIGIRVSGALSVRDMAELAHVDSASGAFPCPDYPSLTVNF